jgi:hypothetical protein
VTLSSNNLTTFTDESSGLVATGQSRLEGNITVSRKVDASSIVINYQYASRNKALDSYCQQPVLTT